MSITIAQTHLTDGDSTTDATSYTTASISPAPNTLVLVWVANSKGGTVDTPTVSGCGMTWTQVNHVEQAGVRSLTCFRGFSAAPTSGALTIDFGGNTQTGCFWSVDQFSGVNPAGSNGALAVRQSGTNSDTSVTSLAVTLSALDSLGFNATAAAGYISAASSLTAGSGLTLTSDLTHGTPNNGFATEVDLVTTDNTPDFTFASSNALMIAVEIRSALSTEHNTSPGTGRGVAVGVS